MPYLKHQRRECGHVTVSDSDACTICDGVSYHMSTDEFQVNAEKLAAWIANYHSSIEDYPVASNVAPGEVRSNLPDRPPTSGEPFEAILEQIDNLVLPGITHWQSPNFYAYFPSNISGPGILGEMLSAGLGVQGMVWKTSPACTEIETHMMDWLVRAMDLPEAFLSTGSGGGVIQDSASSAVLTAIIAAREKATNGKSNQTGLSRPLVAYCSNQTHSSVEKAIRIAGIGSDNLRLIDVDSTFAMIPEALESAIAEDEIAGLQPFFVCSTIGTTSSNAMDPVRMIGEIANRHSIWHHVDAAMSGTASICPEFRHVFDGLELADSYCFNPHKWMMTNFDCSCLYVRDRDELIRSLAINPEYLRTNESSSGRVIDYRDWQIPLGRRFRALKLWFVIRYYGLEGLRYHIRYHVDLSQTVATWIAEEHDLVLDVPPALNLTCFSHVDGDEATQVLLNKINESGRAYLTHTILGDKYVIRWCIGSARTTVQHVKETWNLIQSLL